MARLIWTNLAADGLVQACEYLEKSSPAYASIFAQEVWQTLKLASEQPYVGAMVEELQREDVRERRVGSYRLIYRVVSGGIIALAIHHGARQFPKDLLDR